MKRQREHRIDRGGSPAKNAWFSPNGRQELADHILNQGESHFDIADGGIANPLRRIDQQARGSAFTRDAVAAAVSREAPSP